MLLIIQYEKLVNEFADEPNSQNQLGGDLHDSGRQLIDGGRLAEARPFVERAIRVQ